MGVSNLYSLPYLGMKDGLHKYHYKAGNDFFLTFEHSPITQGDFDITLEVDKRGHLSEFIFYIEGRVEAICDRCLADIRLPVQGKYILHGKISNEDTDDDEIISIKPEQSHIDLSQYIYEMICLSLPLTNVYDCESEQPRVCDDAILNKLTDGSDIVNKDQTEANVWQNLQGWIKEN